jgi:hypothetical protein
MRWPFAVCVCGLLGACTLYGLSGGPQPDSGDGGDASSASDSGATGDALTTGDGASVSDAGAVDGNLLQNAGFELPNPACGAMWVPGGNGGAPRLDPIAHSGAYSCRYCLPPPQDELLQTVKVPVDAGGAYVISAWFAAPGDAAAGSAWIEVVGHLSDGGLYYFHPHSQTTPATTDWQLTQSTGTFDVGTTDLEIVLVNEAAEDGGGACVLWDDVSLTTSP